MMARRGEAAVSEGGGQSAALIVAEWLRLAAAPVFLAMAVVAGSGGGGGAGMICGAGQEASPLGGMAVMYGLMGVFSAGAWLRIVSGRRAAGSF